MDQPAFMRSLQTTAGLGNDVYDAIYAQAMAGIANQLVQSFARQQRHYKERLLMAGFVLELPNIENLNDVGMGHRLQHFTLFVEELKRHLVGEFEQGLQRDVAVHRRGIVAAIHDSHPAFAQLGLDLVPVLNFFYCCHAYLTFPGERIEGPADRDAVFAKFLACSLVVSSTRRTFL